MTTVQDAKLKELEDRRARFTEFRTAVDEDLRAQRVERLAAETAAIEQLVLEAAALDATLGQIKRAYGTKDHRTIADLVRGHAAEITAMRNATVALIKDQPDWFSIASDGTILVEWEGDPAVYTHTVMEDGQLLFNTGQDRWNDDFTIENKAVTLLDGKLESESAEGRVLAKFIRKHQA